MRAFLPLLLILAATFAQGATRGIKLVWDANPPGENVTAYAAYVWTGTNIGDVILTNYLNLPSTNLYLLWTDKNPTTNEQPVVYLPWASTNHPARLVFRVTAVNEFAESAFSEPAMLGWKPSPPGLRVLELAGQQEEVWLAWTNLPAAFALQTSTDLETWMTILTARVDPDCVEQHPWRLDWIHKTTNQPALFWRRLEL